MLLVKKSLNRAPNVFLFALRGSIAAAAIGFVAGASAVAILLGYDWLHGLAMKDSAGLESLSLFCVFAIFGGAAGILPGGVAGFCGALAFEFFRSCAAIVIYAVVAAVMTIPRFNFLGNGSIWRAVLQVVVMDEEAQSNLMHFIGFGEGQRFSHEASHSLSQRVVPTFEVVGRSAFVTAPMLFGGQHLRVRRPEVGEANAALLGFGNALPQNTTGCLTSTTQSISDDLPRAATLSQPQPHLVLAPVNE